MRALHSGDLGDIVYAMAALRARCIMDGVKCEVFLIPTSKTREPMTVERAHSIGDLLSTQPWVQRWKFLPERPSWIPDFDFDVWRAGYKAPENLGESQARFVGVDPVTSLGLAWLSVVPIMKIKVLVARSHRYRNMNFPWAEIGAKLKDSAICVATESEWEELGYQFGFTKRARINTVGDMARLVASADLVITNQTCMRALAEGLKKPVWFERWDECPNVDFKREAVIHNRDEILAALSEL